MASFMLLPFLNINIKYMLPSRQTTVEKDAVTASEYSTPSLSDYITVAEDNLFHPERKIPPEKKAEAAPLPKPDFILYGTLISNELKVAYLEDMKAPRSSTGRGHRQIVLRQGDVLSGFTLREVNNEKVVMVRGEEKITVQVHKKRANRETPTRAGNAAPGQTAQVPSRKSEVATPLQQSPAQTVPHTQADQRIMDALDRRKIRKQQ